MKTSKSQLALHLQDGLSRVSKPLSLLISEMHIGDTQHSSPTNLRRQAQEHIAAINPIKALGESRDGVDLPLVPKNATSNVSHIVANCPLGVAFQAYHFVGALYNSHVNLLQCLFPEECCEQY